MSRTIALDLGTTSIKAGCLTADGKLEGVLTRPVPEVRESHGRYESDALAYFEAADALLDAYVRDSKPPTTMGLCCQRSSFLIWKKSDGEPISPLVSWQDNRGAEACHVLRDNESTLQKLTGLRLTPYYLGPKLYTLFQEHPDWLTGLAKGTLLLGTLDSYCIWHWTNGKAHQTDASMAARTLLMDIASCKWSATLCDLFRVPEKILPAISASGGLRLPLRSGLTLTASLADQSAALYAGVSEDEAEALVNLGTGGFVVRYCESANIASVQGYLHTLVYLDANREPRMAVEGTLNSIASAIAPYPFSTCSIDHLGALENVYCVCEPSGLGAPYFRGDLGVAFSTPVQDLSPEQMASVLLEGIIFRVVRVLEDFHRNQEIRRVYLSGGLSALPCLYRGIAWCCDFEVHQLQQPDSSLLGAALLASGRQAASGRHSAAVDASGDSYKLREKYRRWKNWLDELLMSNVPRLHKPPG